MAKQDSDLGEGKKSGGKKLFLFLFFLVVLGGAGFGVYKFAPGILPFGGDKPGQSGGGGQAGEVKPAVLYSMQPFIVNLVDPSGKRYLKATLSLELDRAEVKSEIETKTVKIRDAVLVLLSSKSFGDISTPEGKRRLREEIVTRINTFLTTGRVTGVYFTEFVVQ
jgi:flagellar FliL protein